MRCCLALVLSVTLAGCQPADTHKSDIEDLQLRVRVLEQGQEQIVEEMRASEAKVSAVPAPPIMNYQLEGGEAAPILYPSKTRCEAAREVKTQAAAEIRADELARGLNRLVKVSYTCVPL